MLSLLILDRLNEQASLRFIYLSPVIDVFLADEALLDAGRAVVADGDVAARQEEDVPLLVGADDALVQTLFVVDAVVVRRPRHVRHQILSLAGKAWLQICLESNITLWNTRVS